MCDVEFHIDSSRASIAFQREHRIDSWSGVGETALLLPSLALERRATMFLFGYKGLMTSLRLKYPVLEDKNIMTCNKGHQKNVRSEFRILSRFGVDKKLIDIIMIQSHSNSDLPIISFHFGWYRRRRKSGTPQERERKEQKKKKTPIKKKHERKKQRGRERKKKKRQQEIESGRRHIGSCVWSYPLLEKTGSDQVKVTQRWPLNWKRIPIEKGLGRALDVIIWREFANRFHELGLLEGR
ncbi:hypothetical protein CEXT_716271 [Caerostris extrusa]|uniref:Uncharacterized protein n=1 Tax=Caerostris extrusa TaxID=172846 RepID=A0AAV4R9J5_CAEEX|nr:hypothetical protein CEXT_716271 [Caerostris extrusa]